VLAEGSPCRAKETKIDLNCRIQHTEFKVEGVSMLKQREITLDRGYVNESKKLIRRVNQE
jgi:hypothetical protein